MKIRLFLVACIMAAMAVTASAQVVRPPEASMHYNRAVAAFNGGGSMLEAKVRVDRVLSNNPSDVDALKLRAKVYLRMQDTTQALLDARRAAALQPEDGEAHLLVAEAAFAMGDERLAEEALVRASQYNLEDAGFHVRLSACAAALGHLQQAEAYARIALQNAPTESAAYYQLARVFMLQQKQEAAVEVILRGLRSAVLNTGAIERDSVLQDLLTRPELQGAFRR